MDSNLNEKKIDCTVLVSSCDAFSDVWYPFFTLFFRYWPDCPYPIHLITNYKTYNHNRVTTIAVGEDRGWASNIRTALKKISAPYLICLLEDFFIEKPVNTNYINSLVKYINDQKVAHIRLFPAPFPDSDFPNNLELGLLSKGVPYRVSLQAGLWDKEILNSLLVDGENAWQMEREGSKRSNNIDMPFLSVKKPALIYHDRSAIIRGRWMYYAVRLCKREGIRINTRKRSISYNRSIVSFLNKAKKHFLLRKIRRIPIIGYFSALGLRFAKKLLR